MKNQRWQHTCCWRVTVGWRQHPILGYHPCHQIAGAPPFYPWFLIISPMKNGHIRGTPHFSDIIKNLRFLTISPTRSPSPICIAMIFPFRSIIRPIAIDPLNRHSSPIDSWSQGPSAWAARTCWAESSWQSEQRCYGDFHKSVGGTSKWMEYDGLMEHPWKSHLYINGWFLGVPPIAGKPHMLLDEWEMNGILGSESLWSCSTWRTGNYFFHRQLVYGKASIATLNYKGVVTGSEISLAETRQVGWIKK